jgi:small-conductance mechanosensitive channel
MPKMRMTLPWVFVFFCCSVLLPGQQAPADAEIDMAPVTIDGILLFSVRGIEAFPAGLRAKTIVRRIREIAADPKIATDSLKAVDAPNYTEIVAGDILVARVFDVDAAIELKGIPRQVLATVYLEKIKEAIKEYRLDRSPRRLLRSGLQAAGATAGFVALLLLFLWLYRKLMSLIESKTKAKILLLQAKSRDLLPAERLGKTLASFLRASRLLLVAMLAYLFLNIVLSLFPWTRLLSKNLSGYVLEPLEKMGRAIIDYIPNLIFIILVIFVVRHALKLVRSFFLGIEHRTIEIRGFDDDWAMPTYKIVRILVIALCVIVIYPYVPGTSSLAFKGLSVFAGLLISLGASSAISNIVAGYTMTYRRAFRVGDRVKIGDYLGDVTAMRLLVTHLKSPKNEEIIVPNSLILNSQVVNFSSIAKDRGLILHTEVTIGYDVPWRQVNAMLLMAAEKTPGVLREPKPFVFQKSLTDFYIVYELNAFTDTPLAMPQIYSDLHKNILDAFNEYGVQITSPNYEGDPHDKKTVPKEKWYAAPSKPPADPKGQGGA